MVQHTLHIDGTTNVYNKHVHVRVTMYPLTSASSTIIHIIHYTECPWQMPKRIPIARAKFPRYLATTKQLLYVDDNILQFFNFLR